MAQRPNRSAAQAAAATEPRLGPIDTPVIDTEGPQPEEVSPVPLNPIEEDDVVESGDGEAEGTPDPPPLVDPPQVTTSLAGPLEMVQIEALKSENAALVGGAHYTLRAGATMSVPRQVADALVAQRMARYLS